MDNEIMNQDCKFFLDCFISHTPVFIITKNENWISGYINSKPTNLKVEILHWKSNLVVPVVYSNIHKKMEFKGSYSMLPKPDYLMEKDGATN